MNLVNKQETKDENNHDTKEIRLSYIGYHS